MKVRLCLALLALTGPLAFAPAPLPRREHGRADEISLACLQGNWRVTSFHSSRVGQLVPVTGAIRIDVAEDCWIFADEHREAPPLFISVDATRRPARLNFRDRRGQDQPVSGAGLVRRYGPGVQVICRWGDEAGRPVAFDPAPDGAWVLTMQQDRREEGSR
jgi:hypothetical protein